MWVWCFTTKSNERRQYRKIVCLSYDVWEAVGKELGIKIEWAEEAGWGNFIEGLRSGRYDAFCSEMWPDQARSKFLTVFYSFDLFTT